MFLTATLNYPEKRPPMVKDVPQGQWFLGRWEEGASTIDAVETRKAVGGELRLTAAATQFFTWCPIRPLHGRAPYRSISAWSLACLTA